MRLMLCLKRTVRCAMVMVVWAGSIWGMYKVFIRLTEHAKRREKHFRLYYLLENQWLKLHGSGHSLEEYFARHGIKRIAVYGMDDIGNRVQEELMGSQAVEVAYLIDEDAYRKYGSGKVVDFADPWDEVDRILVTDEFYFPEIQEKIRAKGDWELLSLKDVILEVLKYGTEA